MIGGRLVQGYRKGIPFVVLDSDDLAQFQVDDALYAGEPTGPGTYRPPRRPVPWK